MKHRLSKRPECI